MFLNCHSMIFLDRLVREDHGSHDHSKYTL